MKTYIIWSLKATASLVAFLGLATLINFLISVVFMTTFADIQLSAIWVAHIIVGISLALAGIEESNR